MRRPVRSAAEVSAVIRLVRWLATARAPGVKEGADPSSVRRDTGRFEAFSDGVFAITITLLILEIRPPTDNKNLLHGLLALWPSYALTFLFIGQVWVNHHVMFDHIRAADRVVLLPRPTVHPDLASLAALSTPDEYCTAGAVQVALLERERFADSQSGAPEQDDHPCGSRAWSPASVGDRRRPAARIP